MYINLKILNSKYLTLEELGLLQIIRQNKIEDTSEHLSLFLFKTIQKRFEEEGYVEYVKPKNKIQTPYNTIRTTSKANTLLDDIETPEIEDQDLKFFDWLFKVYSSDGKIIGNAKKTKLLIAKFRVHSGIDKNNLAFLCKSFIGDPGQFEWSMKLEFLFFKGASVFDTKFDIHQSKLYQYYLVNKPYFDKNFERLNNN